MSIKADFKTTFSRNLLALISLLIAITALGYNSWRNELSEENRTQRSAGFEIMREAAYLQLLVDRATYSDRESVVADPIDGWVRVNLIRSLAALTTDPISEHADQLKASWQTHWSAIYHDEKANEAVSQKISRLNDAVREHLANLR